MFKVRSVEFYIILLILETIYSQKTLFLSIPVDVTPLEPKSRQEKHSFGSTKIFGRRTRCPRPPVTSL